MTENERNILTGALIIANPHYDESYFLNLTDMELEKEYDRMMEG